MEVKHKSWAEKFVEWVFGLPGYVSVIFLPLVFAIFLVAVLINKIKGVS